MTFSGKEFYTEQASTSTSRNYEVLSSTTTGARARVRDAQNEADSRADMLYGQYQDVCAYYTDNFKRSITPVIQRQLAELIRDGMTADVIRMAMDETQMAPRPSWAYCAAILRRCERDRILTLGDWMADREWHRRHFNPAMHYQEQRQDDYGPAFFRHQVEDYLAKEDDAAY